MIHVYAFAEQLSALPDVEGLEQAALERLSLDEVDAVFSRRVEETSHDSLRRDAVAHGAVVDALTTRAAAVAPVRFGERISDDAALAESLRDRLPMLRRTFDRVRDCVEVAVRVHEPRRDGERPASGVAYMRAAGRSHRRDELHAQLQILARDARISRESAAFLVTRERLGEVQGVVDRFALAHKDITVVCTGPWAPFSFVEDTA